MMWHTNYMKQQRRLQKQHSNNNNNKAAVWSKQTIIVFILFACVMSLLIGFVLSLEADFNDSLNQHQNQQQHHAAEAAVTAASKKNVARQTMAVSPNALASNSHSNNHNNNQQCHWRPEPLQGVCDVTKSTPESQQHNASAADCETACCASETCLVFQYRPLEGCLFGAKDTRLGAEKDGVSAWCEPRAPAPWQGQRIVDKTTKEKVPGACSSSSDTPQQQQEPTWKPQELTGQCFGLGPRRTTAQNTARACQQACCQDQACVLWQWQPSAGCFYNKRGFNCQEPKPGAFEPFVGKRKVQASRTYTPFAYSKDYADLAGTLQTTTGA